MTCGSPRVGYTTVTNLTVTSNGCRAVRGPTQTWQLQNRWGSNSGVMLGILLAPNAKAAVTALPWSVTSRLQPRNRFVSNAKTAVAGPVLVPDAKTAVMDKTTVSDPL